MTKNVKQYVPIFISSTYTDLILYRKSVWSVLEKLQQAVSGMEVFGARPEEPLKTCLEEVSRCGIFVGIIGMRYGSVDEETGKSLVQLEYEKALEQSLDILIYLIDEQKAMLPPIFVDVGDTATKLSDFKTLLRKKHTIDLFISPEDLASKVERDLLRLFSDTGWSIEEGKLQPSYQPQETIELLSKFDLMPKRFNGSEVELIIQFSGAPKIVPKNLCKAIGLQFGSSLQREMKIIDPPGITNSLSFTSTIYAEYERCDFLYQAPENKEFKVIARLEFGEEKILHIQPASFWRRSYWESATSIYLGPELTKIKDLDTDEEIENYITHSPVKALVLVKTIK